MRKYIKRILCALVIVAVFSVSFFLGMEKDITKISQGIIADGKLADPCKTGSGTLYYVNADSLNIRTGPGTGYWRVGSYGRCTQVRVYCSSGTWGKISKVADLWMSKNYLQTSKPRWCGNTTTKTADFTKITFDIQGPNYTKAPGMDQMYSNKKGTIVMNLNNIRNLASDDGRLIKVYIYQNNQEVNGWFDIKKEYWGNGSGRITIVQKNMNMPGSKYSVKVVIGDQATNDNTRWRDFNIVGKYYDFHIIQEQSKVTTNFPNNPSSKKNEFDVKISNLVDATNYNAFSWEIKRYDDRGNEIPCTNGNGQNMNCNDKFNVERKNNTLWHFSNKTNNAWERPEAGNYRFYVKYIDWGYSSARGELKDYYAFKIGNRAITFERQDIYSQRYVRGEKVVDYQIKLTRINQNADGVKSITFEEDGKTYTMTTEEFLATYSDFGIDKHLFNGDGHIIYNFDTDKYITFYNPWYVGYNEEDGTWHDSNPEKMNEEFPGVLDQMLTDYQVNDDGRLNYIGTGTKVVQTKYLKEQNQLVFAKVGGRITFTYNYKDVYDEDFQKAKITIKRDDGTVVGANEGFYFDWKWKDGVMTMYLTYDNQDEIYAGDYTIYIEMNQIDTQEVPFTLYIGEVDFYLTSQVDSHLESAEPLETQYPPGNQRYEYYVGFYLVQGGQVLDKKNAKMIDVRIYDHQADMDESGKMFFYDQIDYEIRLQSYLNGKLTYTVSENGGAAKTVTNEALATFTSKYSQAAEMLDMYVYDETTGAVIGNKFELNILRTYNDEEIGDMIVVYEDSDGVETSMELQQFKVSYPDMYAYLITRMVFDKDNSIVQGGIMGNYRITEYSGRPIDGNEVTHLFDINIDPSAENVEKPITILPKTEVPAGEYFVYVTYDNLKGVGFVNNAEDAVISKDLFPEMWEQNIHMTSIIYIDPSYSLEIKDPTLSNVGNDSNKIYNNIGGSAYFPVDYKYIYNYDGVDMKIEFYNGTSWVRAEDRFDIINSIDPSTIYYDMENPYVKLDTIIGKATTGKYRITINYENNGFTATSSKEFNISGKYYGLIIEPGTELKFVHNYEETKTIMAKAMYVDSPGNITPSISRVVGGGNDEILVHDKANKLFKNSLGNTVFKYEYFINEDYYSDDNAVLYEFLITNVASVTDIGNYVLTFSYQEGTNDLSNTTLDFTVGDDEYIYKLRNEKPVANETGMFIYMDIETKFINYHDLDQLEYVIYYYDFEVGKYIDVSSELSTKKMFDVVDSWDANSGPDYEGTLKITLNQSLVDMSGDYYIEAFFRDTSEEFDISNLQALFAWGITDIKIGSVYTHTEVIEGETVTEEVQLDAIYKNLNKANIEVEIESIYENNINWVINKNCISTSTANDCSPVGPNYNSRFTDINTTGEDGKLKLVMREDLTEAEKLKPGEYSLILYYAEDNFQFVTFEVKSEYAEIILDEYMIYTHISEEEVVQGLYKNKPGKIIMSLSLRGIQYDTDLLEISITDSNGDHSVINHFIMDNTGFQEFPHELIFNYDETTNLTPGDYLITISYDTADGPIYLTLPFEMKPEYFNFYVNGPNYTPSSLYPNLENGGLINYVITPEDIPGVLSDSTGIDANSKKHVFAKNTKIYDINGNNVTEYFTIKATNHDNTFSDLSFHLNITYGKNAIVPGTYTVEISYELYNYVVSKTSEFVINDYKKDFNVREVEVISETLDNRVHNNVNGTYRINYESDFNLNPVALQVAITDSKGTDLTSHFDYNMTDKYIDIIYTATTPYVEPGDLNINLTYLEEGDPSPYNTTVKVTMYGKYIDLTLNNLVQSEPDLYSDLENQYLTFNLTSAIMTEEQKSQVIFKVFDKDKNIVYSDDSKDNVTNKFKITNNLANGGNIKLDILPFKARVGQYSIVAYLIDAEGDENISNELKFTIDFNYYYVRFSTKNTFEPVVAYENDLKKIYDRDGADIYYQFVTNFNSVAYDEFSIQIYDGLKLVKEIDANFAETDFDGVEYITTEFLTGGLPVGEYNVAVAINGLPYNEESITVSKYIPISKATIYINGNPVGDKVTVFKGQILELEYVVEPSNATNKVMKFQSSDNETIMVDDETRKAYIYGSGEATIKLTNQDITVQTVVSINDRLSSDTYTIDYDNHYIYVSTMTDTRLSKEAFLSNLKAVAIDHRFKDAADIDVTDETTFKNVGTGYQLVNGSETYTIVVIGDINQDARISLVDVAQLFAYATKDTDLSNHQIKAGDINKDNKFSLVDVAKLFAFAVKDINEL